METRIDEIADGIYRLSTYMAEVAPPAGFAPARGLRAAGAVDAARDGILHPEHDDRLVDDHELQRQLASGSPVCRS